MRDIVARLSILFLLCAFSGCLSANKALYPPVRQTASEQSIQTVSTFSAPTSPLSSVYVVSNGWHAGLILKRDDVDLAIWPELAEIPSTEFVEIGWGNEGFYMAKEITPGLVLGALVPSPSVLHVAGFTGDIERIFRGAELVRIELSKQGLDEMCRFIHVTYVHDNAGQTVRLGPGLYGESEFYRAHGKYYFPNTCNVWTANALRAAGCPITPAYASTAQNLVFQAKQFPTSQCPPFSTKSQN